MSTVKRRVLVAAAEFGAVIRYLRENEATFDAKTGEIARFPWRIKGVSHRIQLRGGAASSTACSTISHNAYYVKRTEA